MCDLKTSKISFSTEATYVEGHFPLCPIWTLCWCVLFPCCPQMQSRHQLYSTLSQSCTRTPPSVCLCNIRQWSVTTYTITSILMKQIARRYVSERSSLSGYSNQLLLTVVRVELATTAASCSLRDRIKHVYNNYYWYLLGSSISSVAQLPFKLKVKIRHQSSKIAVSQIEIRVAEVHVS